MKITRKIILYLIKKQNFLKLLINKKIVKQLIIQIYNKINRFILYYHNNNQLIKITYSFYKNKIFKPMKKIIYSNNIFRKMLNNLKIQNKNNSVTLKTFKNFFYFILLKNYRNKSIQKRFCIVSIKLE